MNLKSLIPLFSVLGLTACTSTPMNLVEKSATGRENQSVTSREGLPVSTYVYEDASVAVAAAPENVEIVEAATESVVNTNRFNEIELHFDTNAVNMNANHSQQILQDLDTTAIDPNQQIEVIGFADKTGDPDYNLDLSIQRAVKVSEYLNQMGFSNVKTIGGGSIDAPSLDQARVVKIRSVE